MIKWFQKQLTRMVHSGQNFLFSLLPRTRYDYRREVGDGYGSSVIMAPVKFIQRVFPEAPLGVKTVKVKDGTEEIVPRHPMIVRIDRPNDFYSGNALWRATIASWILNGNAYWLKVRNSLQEVVQLWWIPHWLISPKWPQDGSVFISHYEYKPGFDRPMDIQPSEIVHFRNGLDPRNPRLGMSDLHSVLREVFSDDEASNFTASLLRNMGVPGVVISPKQGTANDQDAQSTKEWFLQETTGDRRGAPLVMRGPTEVHQFAWSPAQMELGSIRDVSEERVTAILGIPAAVVGFGAGLQQTKVGATMRELVQLAWISCIVPMQHIMAGDLQHQLLPDFQEQAELENVHVFFDSAMVEALQESEKEKASRINILVRGGLMKVSEGRRAFRLPVDPSDEVYLRSGNVIGIPSWAPPPAAGQGGSSNAA